MKKFWKILIIVLLVLLVLVGGYVAYVFLDYHRIPDNQTLDVYEQEPSVSKVLCLETVSVPVTLTLLLWQ